jgi:hypothetical protein
MLYFRRSRFIRFVILPLTLVALLPACTFHKWSTMQGSPDLQIRSKRPEQIRVTVDDGSQVEMRSPWIQGDSILALTEQGATLVIRVSDVSKLEERKEDRVMGAVVAGGIIAVLYAVCSGNDDNFSPC